MHPGFLQSSLFFHAIILSPGLCIRGTPSHTGHKLSQILYTKCICMHALHEEYRVLRCFTGSYIIGWKETEIFLNVWLVSFIVRSPSSSYIRGSIAACVANIVLDIIYWSCNSYPSYVLVKISITLILDSAQCFYVIAYTIAILSFSGISRLYRDIRFDTRKYSITG